MKRQDLMARLVAIEDELKIVPTTDFSERYRLMTERDQLSIALGELDDVDTDVAEEWDLQSERAPVERPIPKGYIDERAMGGGGFV